LAPRARRRHRGRVGLRHCDTDAWAPSLATRLETPAAGWAAPQYNRLAAVFAPGASVYDGRFANNGWLQETPDPLTKLVWDNAALIGPSTAKALGLTDGDVVRLEVDGRTLEIRR